MECLGYNPLAAAPTTLGQRIKLYRRLHGLSQKRFAKELGIDPTTLARWEKGESKPSNKLKKRLFTFLSGILSTGE
ncbi:MAG: helix-turn-helix transcriptional regulator [Ignavibacteriae bacterium]|nr:helix-turn-helix transcriptional regulator [Ignavibacteriota bacterium]